jgi:apolipoprotein N-acyltransferase
MSANVREQFDKVFLQLEKVGLLLTLNWRSLILVLLLGCGTLISGQQAQKHGRESLNYGFISPNTRDDLKIEEAIRGMNSSEESRLLKEAEANGE